MVDPTSGTPIDVLIFAKIFPEGSDAEQALDWVYKSPLSDYHKSFIHVELKTRKVASDSDSGSERSTDQRTERWCGYYELSLQRLPTNIPAGWRLGRGSSE